MKKALSLVLVLAFSFAFFASAETTHVKVGIVGSTNEQWTDVLVPKLAEEGIEIELVYFSDYVMPNIAAGFRRHRPGTPSSTTISSTAGTTKIPRPTA